MRISQGLRDALLVRLIFVGHVGWSGTTMVLINLVGCWRSDNLH